MEELVLSAWDTILSLLGTVFNVLFFWLPDDPLSAYLDSASVQAANAQAVRWLNWFVDVNLAANVFAMFISVLLLFAVFKLMVAVIDFAMKAIDAFKPI